MIAKMRNLRDSTDYIAISDFLYTLYQPDNRDGNWFQPIWEYAYTHSMFDEDSVGQIGIWEDDGAIVGVALYESVLGEAFFNIHHNYEHLKPEMLEYAEGHLKGKTDEGKRYLKAYVNDFDTAFEDVVKSRGYELEPRSHRPMSQYVITDPFSPIRLPEGFKLKSLADDNDLAKVHRALWRGFNHPGEPPAEGIEWRRKMQTGPNFRKDLTIVVEAPNGDFVAFSGLWFEHINKFGYVEPVATDPDYRRMGLGTAAVMEGVRRCGELGADVAYVGTDKPFYLSMGFKKLFSLNCWIRYF